MQLQSYLDHPSHGVADTPSTDARESHLTADQLLRLARALHDDLEHLHERLAHHDAAFGLLADDASVDATERHVARRAVDHDRQAIRNVNDAIASIDDGTYGACIACGRAIPFERLEALPATRTCVSCPDPSP